jgi:hypothetical protein
LCAPLAPLGCYEARALALASDCPPQRPNLGFPPNSLSASPLVTPSWSVVYMSALALLVHVSALYHACDTRRSRQLNYTTPSHREHLDCPSGLAIVVSRELWAGLVQLRDGLGSPGVELGVYQVRTLVFAHSGRYKFTGGRARRRSPSGT